MRRVLAVTAAGLVALLAACVPGSGNPPAAPWPSPVAESSSGTVAVCARITDAFSDAMGPLGTAFGKLIGARAADDDDAQSDAAAEVVEEMKSLTKELRDLGRNADDTQLQQAVSTSATNIDKLADDPAYLGGLTKITDVPVAINKISAAAQPLTQACA